MPAAISGTPSADATSAAVVVDGESELVVSLMSADGRSRPLGMINSSIAAERSAAIDGTAHRQIELAKLVSEVVGAVPALLDGAIHAVLGIPARLGGGPVGTLNVAADRNDKLARQLQYALEYRVPIERAVERRRVSELAEAILARRRVL
ncbi:hypothetical protein [Candidatus Frankia alpina]|uniref:hypothetical protein n=1 Tax=Candidatus Frankia alpina TaxID=2699483 RepID=UPI001F1D1A4C|nr:hypothetical protein [Candidatus Frankia alpina]